MRFDNDTKQRIVLYILEKISENRTGITVATTENFSISKNTVINYLKELQTNGIIEKVKRDTYKLVTTSSAFVLKKNDNQLSDEQKIYDKFVFPLIKDFQPNVLEIWLYVISEMVNNVIDHSEATELNIQINQDHLKTEIILADNGIGIFNKIQKHFSLDDSDDAICELFKGKLTTDESNHSGEGIFFTSKILDSFAILSCGKVFTMDKFNNSQLESNLLNSSGTIVSMELSNFTNKRMSDVFDRFSTVEQGVIKTIIPLKNAFVSAPVSRSQAKRVCARLERFREVVLDFSDISWAGQGFMHEIFVVFAKRNPDIKITPVNMSEDIQNMLGHVVNG